MFSLTRSAAIATRSLAARRTALFSLQAADKHTLVLVRHGESTWNLENKVCASIIQ
jgi:2,3-bisphosphoglycerate-dependent phosphoglycerate mutase